mgnify:CR=1 FL=1
MGTLAAALVFSGIWPAFYTIKPGLSAYGEPSLDYRVAAYRELPGWLQDDPGEALGAFLLSCERMSARDEAAPANSQEYLGERLAGVSLGGTVGDWLAPCAAAAGLDRGAYAGADAWRSAVRVFFESHFTPVEIRDRRAPLPDGPARRHGPRIETSGLFTGYFEPSYPASPMPTADFSAPVYRRPDDLIDVDLGAFRPKLAGQRIAGRIEGNKLVPYADHGEINGGALAGKVQPLAWMRPNDLFFLQIQGSGRLDFNDGSPPLRIGYAGQNGRAYTAIGRTMVDRDIMRLEDVSMQSIREWLDHADEAAAREMREQNASYVFFTELDMPEDPALGPLGAQGAPLTAGRSLAVDRRYHTLGAPVFVDIEPVSAHGPKPIRRLMIAQDTGGAIKGPVRGDVFWGAGDEAGAVAGEMKAAGRLYVLVPAAVVERLSGGAPAQ